MSQMTVTDDLSRQEFDALSPQTEKRAGRPAEDAVAPIVLSVEDLALAAGGLLTRKVNEYEGQH